MVTEHRARGFPEEWLASTHGLASTGNGIAAVLFYAPQSIFSFL